MQDAARRIAGKNFMGMLGASCILFPLPRILYPEPMRGVQLIHWNATEAKERVERLKAAGYEV